MSLMSDLGAALKSKLNLKADKNNPTFTGNVVLPSTTKIGTIDSTKISYLNNITSDIQSQINLKQDVLSSSNNIKTINNSSILGAGNLDLTSMSITGNSGSATKLQTYRKINNTAFDGTSDIVTAIWGTTRNITVGNNMKVINGSADVSFTHAEIGTVKDLGIKTINPVIGDNMSCTTAQFISFLTTLGAFTQPLSVIRVTWNYAGVNNINDTGFGQLELAGCIIETFYSSANQYIIRVTSPSTGVGAGAIHEYVYHGDNYLPGWRRVYTSDLNGNCDTATKLQTARTINGVAFDGTANITIISVPSGAIFAFARSTAPEGYLKCNGALISRTTYATLFSAIGTTFGSGDGSTTFALPDLRGMFLRGWDDARGVDAGRSFGSSQEDDFKSHGHTIYINTNKGYSTGGTTWDFLGSYGAATSTGGAGGTETRPKNIALLYCIKY